MPAILTVGGEGTTIETTLETSAKTYPRPVREIIEGIRENLIETPRNFINNGILPWINTDAVANRAQEIEIQNFPWGYWARVSDKYVPQLITMLNTLRG